jgi:hypothetical protein
MNNEIIKARVLLSKTMGVYNNLLDQLESESENLNAYDKEKFSKRLAILDDFCTVVLHYDEIVQQHIRVDANVNDTKRLQDQLKIAQKYVQRLGGDWSIVTWGKLSDY